MEPSKKVGILETTLRDGSYAVNFTFSTADTAMICQELEKADFDLIEIGHGVGLGASNGGMGKASATDEEYMEAAAGTLKRAKYGMFCIPGIARLEDIDLARKYKMGFIRIGTNVAEVDKSEAFIKKAKDAGMFVASNFMKSYAVAPDEFARQALLSQKYGADMVYIVDSAGGMFPEDVRKYFQAIRKVSDIAIGFHGHDNLGMAVSNSIEAVKLGALYVDSSLQGLGRSAGNACTEVLVAALGKLGVDCGIDLLKVVNLGVKFVQPLLESKGRMPLDIVAGFADFHSSYMHHIQKFSSKYRVDPAVLIMEMCKIDKVNMDVGVLEAVAQAINKVSDLYPGYYGFKRYVGGEQDWRGV